MLQDRAESKANYRRFIERVRDSQEVWGLRFNGNWAYCVSNDYEDTDVLVFWSDRAYAQRHVKGEWSAHEPAVIPLDEFIDKWLRGMSRDGVLVGPNWDAGLCGLEVQALQVAEKLAGRSARQVAEGDTPPDKVKDG